MSQLIEKAVCFAAVKHDGHYRKGTHTPYITHPYGVALILTEENQAEKVVAAGLLHDTLEDTATSEEELFTNFGEEILMLVKAASEPDKSLSWEIRKQHTIDKLSSQPIDETYLILADKLHNLRSIHTDYNTLGNALWKRFKRGKREQSWYYMSIVNALKNRKKEIPLIKSFEEEASLLFIGKKRLTTRDVQSLFKVIQFEISSDQSDFFDPALKGFVDELLNSVGSNEAPVNTEQVSLQKLLQEHGVDKTVSQQRGLNIYAPLSELKFRLGWDDKTFLDYLKHYA